MPEVELSPKVEILFDRVGELRVDHALGDFLAVLLESS